MQNSELSHQTSADLKSGDNEESTVPNSPNNSPANSPSKATIAPCQAKTKNGSNCKRFVKLPAKLCVQHFKLQKSKADAGNSEHVTVSDDPIIRCLGTTKKGEQCKKSFRKSKAITGYCHLHKDQAENTEESNQTIPEISKKIVIDQELLQNYEHALKEKIHRMDEDINIEDIENGNINKRARTASICA